MSPCVIICNFSVVQAAGHMFKSNPADVITNTPKPVVRSLRNHKKEANTTPVTVSNFTITMFVTDCYFCNLVGSKLFDYLLMLVIFTCVFCSYCTVLRTDLKFWVLSQQLMEVIVGDSKVLLC